MKIKYPKKLYCPIYALIFLLVLLISCTNINNNENSHKNVAEKQVVTQPEDINETAEKIIQGTLKDILQNNKQLNDSFKITNAVTVQYLYVQNNLQPIWSSKGRFINGADS